MQSPLKAVLRSAQILLNRTVLEAAPPIDLTYAEEMLRQLQQHNPNEFDRIVMIFESFSSF